jgi:hypothetical protein
MIPAVLHDYLGFSSLKGKEIESGRGNTHKAFLTSEHQGVGHAAVGNNVDAGI